MSVTQSTVATNMESQPSSTQKPISLIIEDRVQLHNHYMPFIESGAIFIPTSESFQLGDEVQANVFLKQYNKKIPVLGTVCWVNFQASKDRESHKKQGIGVQFSGEKAERVKDLFEKVLGDLVNHKPKFQVY